MAPEVAPTLQSRKPKLGSRFVNFWRTAHHQAWDDLKTRGKSGAFWVLYSFFLIGLIFAFTLLAIMSSLRGMSGLEFSYTILAPVSTGQDTACQADGNFYTNPNDFNYWHTSGFFQITLGFGNFSFTTAKVIDVMWDVIVGRGGQSLLALVSWRVFSMYVTTSMQVAPVTFSSFWSIFMQSDSTAISIIRLVRDFSFRRGLHSRVAMVFMIATMAFILAFPTFASAMTGYSSNVSPFVPNAENNGTIPFAMFQPLYYVIHDGDRIGKSKDYKVMDDGDGKEALFSSLWMLYSCYAISTTQSDFCHIIGNATQYVVDHQMHSKTTNITSSFMGISLRPPTLNITTYSVPPEYIEDFPGLFDGDRTWLTRPEGMAWVLQDQIFNQTQIQDTGRCLPTKTYNWGFSFIQVELMIVLLLFWLIGIFSMYLRSYATMRKRGITEVVGKYKAVFELAKAMQTQLNNHPGTEETRDPTLLTEEKLERRIAKDLDGGSIAFECDLLIDSTTHEKGAWKFRSLLKKNAWWLLVVIVLETAPAIFVALLLARYGYAAMILPFITIFAMCVRTSGKSGFVLVFWPLCVVILIQMLTLFAGQT